MDIMLNLIIFLMVLMHNICRDFDKDGNFIDETINIEIIPYKTKKII